MATAYNLQISEGGIVKLLDVASRNGEETYNNIKKKLRESDVVYTEMKQDQEKMGSMDINGVFQMTNTNCSGSRRKETKM